MKRTSVAVCLSCLICLAYVSTPTPRVSAQATAGANDARTLRLAGLKAVVNVRRDARGVPYVEAANEDDLYFAQGYVTAGDRLWQMDLLRRTARGELSEIFGAAALEEDKRQRVYGFAQLSQAMEASLPSDARRALEAYARGVNAYIDSLDAKSLPAEFRLLQYRPRPWTVADSLVVGKNLAEALTTSWQTDLVRASLADLPPDKRAALLPEVSPLDVLVVGRDRTKAKGPERSATKSTTFLNVGAETLGAASEAAQSSERTLARVGLYAEARAASNNFVVSGARTKSGRPMLENDPHLSASAPSIWYMTHLSAPGLRVAGVTVPGAPGVIVGHNERVAWGVTNLGADVQDVYVEKFDPQNPRRYQTPQGWRDAEVRREEIRVRRNPASPETEVVPFDVTVTRHGPVFLEREGARYSLRWSALDPQSQEFAGLFALGRTHDWKEFTRALGSYNGPSLNFVYADADGHVGYYGAGRVPVRKSGDGSLPYDGATDAGEWTGYVPFAQLPHLFDPPSGLIVTANQRVTGGDFPIFLTHEWAQPYRARRILDLLQTRRKLTAEDLLAVAGDNYSFGGATFARGVVAATTELTPAAEADPLAGKWQAALAELKAWDGMMSPDSRAAVVAAQMRAAFRRRILNAALGAERARNFSWDNLDVLLDRLVIERPAGWLPSEFRSYAELLRACYADARQALTQRIGEDELRWTWGNWAQVRFPHPLAAVPVVGQQFMLKPFPQSGSGYVSGVGPTVNAGSFVSMRMVADLGDWDATRQGIAPGQSGDPSSPHWSDQLADWRAVTPQVFRFGPAAVRAAATETLVLTPAGTR